LSLDAEAQRRRVIKLTDIDMLRVFIFLMFLGAGTACTHAPQIERELSRISSPHGVVIHYETLRLFTFPIGT
jgi:hypothetical protein